jgi:hypothetical protein
VDNAPTNGYGYGFCAVVYIQFRQYVLEMTLNSFFTNTQDRGDFLVPPAVSDQLQNFQFSR